MRVYTSISICNESGSSNTTIKQYVTVNCTIQAICFYIVNIEIIFRYHSLLWKFCLKCLSAAFFFNYQHSSFCTFIFSSKLSIKDSDNILLGYSVAKYLQYHCNQLLFTRLSYATVIHNLSIWNLYFLLGK